MTASPVHVRNQSTAAPSSRPASRVENRGRSDTTDSKDSNTSKRSRRESLKSLARTVSNEFKEKMSLVSMDKKGRNSYIRQKHVDHAIEERRRSAAPVTNPRSSSTSSRHSQEPISKGERLALNVGKAIDPVRIRGIRRKGTDDSYMSFADPAPVGAMHACAWCDKPTYETLKEGLCAECDREAHGKKKKGGK